MLLFRAITPLNDATPVERRGRRTEATTRSIATRNRLLIEAAARHCAGQSSRSAASALRGALVRYREGAWRRHRVEDQCPVRLVGRLDEYLWRILRARDHVPSERTIRRALAK
jgi:hypothetical protein